MNELPGGIPNMLVPRGTAAQHIATLGWVLIIISIVVLALVLVAMLVPLARTRQTDVQDESGYIRREHNFVLIVGAAIPALILLGVYLYSMKDIGLWEFGNHSSADVQVIGHQFWWEVRYPALGIRTANEIHIPAGTRVKIALASADVIHSFWVPQLHGKLDLVPGKVNRFWIEADSAGTYRGECAEFCGPQHAHMDFTVVALPKEEFQRWATAQRRPAAPPASPMALQGSHEFEKAGCAACHAINGSNAHGSFGPDLTHFASRLTIAGGMMPNTRGALAGWVVGAQHLKPGSLMPNVRMSGAELQTLLAYLEGLK